MKQDKSSVVANIQNNYRSYPGNSGDIIYVHLISFINGDQGELHTTIPTCTEFVSGASANYSIEPKFFKGTEVMRIKPILVASNTPQINPVNTSDVKQQPTNETHQKPFKREFKDRPARNETAIMAQHAISKSVELISNGVIDLDQLYSTADQILKWTLIKASTTPQDIINQIDTPEPQKRKRK